MKKIYSFLLIFVFIVFSSRDYLYAMEEKKISSSSSCSSSSLKRKPTLKKSGSVDKFFAEMKKDEHFCRQRSATLDLGNFSISGFSEIFVFQISSKNIEVETTEKNIKKVYKQFLKLDATERLLLDDMVGGAFLSGLSFVVTGNKDKLNKEVRGYYENKKLDLPKEVEASLLKVLNELSKEKISVEKLKKYVGLLNKGIAGEDKEFAKRIWLLSTGIFKGEEKLKKEENFKMTLKKIGLMEKDDTIPIVVKCLWGALLQGIGISGEIKIMSLDEAYQAKRIYKKE